ncbi:hypothetical protein WR25_01905 [Diploscapter pachys]|uniref:C2H2-type domain-containing protein n=1 Tax=Diploscapter pachys TaxID=2018661 RepID=A0A2A2KYH4_9BILA|nr:hypothetical protein WR25_01905 [Diploscapter pachys]
MDEDDYNPTRPITLDDDYIPPDYSFYQANGPPRVKRMDTVVTQDVIIYTMAPDSPDEYGRQLTVCMMDKRATRADLNIDRLLDKMAKLFNMAESRAERINALAVFADCFSIVRLRIHIPSLSNYIFYEAKRWSHLTGGFMKEEQFSRIRFNPRAITTFIHFITDSSQMVQLPFGTRRIKFEDGTVEEIGDVMRKNSASYTIQLFEKYLRDTDQVHLTMSRPFLFKLLKVCSASPRRSYTCVDSYVAEAYESFNELDEILSNWSRFDLFDETWTKNMRKALTDSRLYISNDYRLRCKTISRVNDHCTRYSLSDPDKPDLADRCNEGPDAHEHDMACPECERTKSTFTELIDAANNIIKNLSDELNRKPNDPNLLATLEQLELDRWTINSATKVVNELKKHQMRCAQSSRARTTIVDNLEEKTCLITMDFGMRYIPRKFMEKQVDFFGKKGKSYMVAHVLCKFEGRLAQHTYAFLLPSDKQDKVSVIACVRVMLVDLEKMGVQKVILRSDNAGCYHSSALLGSIYNLTIDLKIRVTRYIFSESQDGKSDADRQIARLKKRLNDRLLSGYDVVTVNDMFDAWDQGKPLPGLSCHVVEYKLINEPTFQLPNIRMLGDFQFEENEVIVRRYFGIGRGTSINRQNLRFTNVDIHVEREGGPGLSKNTTVEKETQLIRNSDQPIFWYLCGVENKKQQSQTKSVTKAVSDIENGQQSSSTSMEDEPLGYLCTFPGCRSSFLSLRYYELHLLRGKHDVRPETESAMDVGAHAYVDDLEGRSIRKGKLAELTDLMEHSIPTQGEFKIEPLGWAIRTLNQVKRHSQKAKDFLVAKFKAGIGAGKKKADPAELAKEMRTLKEGGVRVFSPDECLNAKQIKSYFSVLNQRTIFEADEQPTHGVLKSSNRPSRSLRKPIEQIADDAENEQQENEGDAEEIYRKDPEYEAEEDDDLVLGVVRNRTQLFED